MRKHLLLYVSTITHFSESTSSKYFISKDLCQIKIPLCVFGFHKRSVFQFIKHGSIIQKNPKKQTFAPWETVTDQ